MLYEERGLIWGCEADTVSMLTKTILKNKALGVPIMMTNLYPFLLGNAALKHERIPAFPGKGRKATPPIIFWRRIAATLASCRSRVRETWEMRPKILAIVDENAAVIDARMDEGPVTLLKLEPPLNSLSVVEADLIGYAGCPRCPRFPAELSGRCP